MLAAKTLIRLCGRFWSDFSEDSYQTVRMRRLTLSLRWVPVYCIGFAVHGLNMFLIKGSYINLWK